MCTQQINVNDYVDTSGPKDCVQKSSKAYLQFFCLGDNDDVNIRRVEGLYIACLGIFMSCLFLSMIYYLSKTSNLDFKMWDVLTVTPSDFTVEYPITA